MIEDKIPEIKRGLQRLAVFLLMMGLVITFTKAGDALDFGDSLSATNEKITLLYIDALNFYKEGEYKKAAKATEELRELFRSDFYVRGVRKALNIPPDEETLRTFLGKIKGAEADLNKATRAFKDKDYALAAQIFLSLREESPQSSQINSYLEKIADIKIQERLKEKTPGKTGVIDQLLEEDDYYTGQVFSEAQQRKLFEEKILALEREKELRQLAEAGEQTEKEFTIKKEELARRRQEQLERINRAKEKHQEKFQNQQEQIAQEKEELEQRVSEIKKSIMQEKVLAQAALAKQRADKAKVFKIEKIWREANKLYNLGSYEEAIGLFEEVIKLEGNPRIKYTPQAKELINRAKGKIVDADKSELTKQLELKEKEMMNEVLDRQVPENVEPPAIIEESEVVSLVEPPLIRKKIKTTKVSLEFDKVSLKSVMQFLAKESGINIILSQKVLDLNLKASVRFSETPVEEVIKYITKSLGLVYRIDQDVIWIALVEEIENEAMETRVYYLARGGGLFTEFSPLSGGGTESGLGSSSASINKITTIADTLKEVVPWPSGANLTYDKRINALIVRNTPQNLQMLEDMIYNLDILPFQILIEARFLEVDITDTKEFGLEWKFNADWATMSNKAKADKMVFKSDSGVDFSSFTRASEGLNLTYKGVLTTPQFQTVLHALEETKKIKTLSSPRITTLNNQPATIKIVDEWIYPTRYEYEVVQSDINGDGDFSDAGETTYKNVPKDFLRRDVGILLKVIPSVGADRKTINLSLIPEVSEATADAFSYTGDVKLPKFTSRNLSTTIVVNSGDTVVLGGLIKESRTKTLTQVPLLCKLPIIGHLFKKESDSVQRKNLLIFVTAKVISSSGEEIIIKDKK